MTSTEHTEQLEHGDHDGHERHERHVEAHAHKPNSFYIQVAIALAVVTALEVALYYMDIGKLFMPVLLILMAIKFLTVVSMFMHLRFDNKIFSYLFYSGLILAIIVYIVALMTFQFFEGS